MLATDRHLLTPSSRFAEVNHPGICSKRYAQKLRSPAGPRRATEPSGADDQLRRVIPFLAWGRDEDEAESIVREARAKGILSRGDTVVQAAWQGSDPSPASRWIGTDSLTWREIEVLADLAADQCGLNPNAPVGQPCGVYTLSNAELFAAALGSPAAREPVSGCCVF